MRRGVVEGAVDEGDVAVVDCPARRIELLSIDSSRPQQRPLQRRHRLAQLLDGVQRLRQRQTPRAASRCAV